MVIRQSQRRHHADFHLAITGDGLHRAPAQAEDRNFRLVDDGREMRPANRALIRDRERAALHFVGGDFAVTGFLGELFEFLRQIEHALLVHVADDRNDQARVRVHRDADVEIFLEHDLARYLVEAGVEDRVFLQRFDQRLEHERREGQLRSFGFVGGRKLFAQLVQPREVGLVELRDVRDGVPAFPHAPRDDLTQRRESFLAHRPPLGEINRLGSGFRRRSGGSSFGLLRRLLQPLDVSAQIAQHDAPTRFTATHAAQINAQVPRGLANGRRRNRCRQARRSFARLFNRLFHRRGRFRLRHSLLCCRLG